MGKERGRNTRNLIYDRKGGRKPQEAEQLAQRGRTGVREETGGQKQQESRGEQKRHATNETGRQVKRIKWRHLVVQVGGKLDPNG